MNIFVSMPMNGKTDEEILNKIKEIEHKFPQDTVTSGFVNYDYLPQTNNTPVYCLSWAIEKIGCCDVVYFAQGWQTARGCQIEHDICVEYGIPMMFEDDEDE